jgi:hypothetical protein
MQLKGSLGHNEVSSILHQNVDDLLFLIDGTPQVLELTVDFQVQLIQVPDISNWPSAPHGFEANGKTAFSHQELHIAITQAEAKIQPNTLADRVDGESMTGIAALRNRRVIAAQLR